MCITLELEVHHNPRPEKYGMVPYHTTIPHGEVTTHIHFWSTLHIIHLVYVIEINHEYVIPLTVVTKKILE
jgi:hypothetical protein